MKKTLLNSLLSSLILLGGCASQNVTDNSFDFHKTEQERIEKNKELSQMDKITIQFIDLKNVSDVDKIFLNQDMNALYLNDSDYLKRIESIDANVSSQSNLFIKDSDINEFPRLFKNTTVQSYIQDVEIKMIDGIGSQTDFTIGTIEYGFEMKTVLKKSEETGKDIIELHIKNSTLNQINKIPVGENDYIEDPELSIENIRSTLSFDTSGHFIKKVKGEKFIIISLRKTGNINQEEKK